MATTPAPLTRTIPPPPHPWWSPHHRGLSRCRIRWDPPQASSSPWDPVGSASSVVVIVGSGGICLPPPPHWLPPCRAEKHRRAARPRPHHTNEHSSLNLRRWIQATPVRSRHKYPRRRRQVRGAAPLSPSSTSHPPSLEQHGPWACTAL